MKILYVRNNRVKELYNEILTQYPSIITNWVDEKCYINDDKTTLILDFSKVQK